jgi:hypothetical protein
MVAELSLPTNVGLDLAQTARRMSLAGGPESGGICIFPAMRGIGPHPCDPRNLIHEAYRIEGIGVMECRAIFFDWAVGLEAGMDPVAAARRLHEDLAPGNPDHPMTALLAEAAHGLTPGRGRARGRRGRH